MADQEDVPMKARMREIERIYAKANAKVRTTTCLTLLYHRPGGVQASAL